MILEENIKKPECRFNNSSIFDERTRNWQAQTRVVRLFKASCNINIPLRMQIQKACVNTRHIEAYHLNEYGIVIDKQTGRVVCLVEGEFKFGEKGKLGVIIKTKKDAVLISKTSEYVPVYTTSAYNDKVGDEKVVTQDNEISGIHDVKESAYSWRACLLRKFIAKHLDEIKEWAIDTELF